MTELPSVAQVMRAVSQQGLSIYNRLRSIDDDVEFVDRVAGYYANLPVVANLRCGRWYYPEFDAEVHFKSADGHRGQWKLSLKRLNLHLLPLLANKGGCILVDSTRKARTLPDSFSRTVPMWCAVVNRIAKRLYPQAAQWDTNLHCPQTTVPPQELCQMQDLLDARVEAVLESGVDLSLIKALKKPLRATWVTTTTVQHWEQQEQQQGYEKQQPREERRGPKTSQRGSGGDDSDGTDDGGNARSGEDATASPSLPSPSSTPAKGLELEPVSREEYAVVVCVCASPPVDIEQRSTYMYVQGAADDEETWSMGLSPQLFWQHKTELLDGDPDTCGERVRALVAQAKQEALDELTPDVLADRDLILANVVSHPIGDTLLSIGNKFAAVQPWCFEAFDAVIACCLPGELPQQQQQRQREGEGEEEGEEEEDGEGEGKGEPQQQGCVGGDTKREACVIYLPVPPGKKHKKEMEQGLVRALRFVRHHLHQGHRILIASATGEDRAPTLAVATLAAFFTSELRVNWDREHRSSDAAAIARPTLAKADFTRCLQSIRQGVPSACPTRHNMRKLTTFFLSRPLPPSHVWQDTHHDGTLQPSM